jgi:hypothetical protein
MEYYTKEQTENLLKENNIDIESFDKWMFGQTCPIENGELCYYKYDIDRLIRYKGDARN